MQIRASLRGVAFWSVHWIKVSLQCMHETHFDELSSAMLPSAVFLFHVGGPLFAGAPSLLRLVQGRRQVAALDSATLKARAEANASSNLFLVNIVGGGTCFLGHPVSARQDNTPFLPLFWPPRRCR